MDEKSFVLEYIKSNTFKENTLHILFGGIVDKEKKDIKKVEEENEKFYEEIKNDLKDTNTNIVKQKKTKEQKRKRDEITSILFEIINEIRNLIFSLIPIPIPPLLKDKILNKGQIDTLWDSQIAPLISNITNTSNLGARTNIRSPFKKPKEEEIEIVEKEKLNEKQEMQQEEKEIKDMQKKLEKQNIENESDEDPIEVKGGLAMGGGARINIQRAINKYVYPYSNMYKPQYSQYRQSYPQQFRPQQKSLYLQTNASPLVQINLSQNAQAPQQYPSQYLYPQYINQRYQQQIPQAQAYQPYPQANQAFPQAYQAYPQSYQAQQGQNIQNIQNTQYQNSKQKKQSKQRKKSRQLNQNIQKQKGFQPKNNSINSTKRNTSPLKPPKSPKPPKSLKPPKPPKSPKSFKSSKSPKAINIFKKK